MAGVYSMEYVTTETAESKTCTVTWTIFELNKLFGRVGQRDNEFVTKEADYADNADEDTKLPFKIEFIDRYVFINYLAPVSMYLKYKTDIIMNCGHYRVTRIHNLLSYLEVEPNTWVQLVTLLKQTDDQYPCNDRIIIKTQFTISKELKSVQHPKYKKRRLNNTYVPKGKQDCDVEDELKVNCSSFSDVIIKSAEGVKFQTHKAVLAAHSDVLKAHFVHNTVESQTNIIESPLETEVIEEVLRYIYTDGTPKIDEMPKELLAAADYYQLTNLKKLCEEALLQKFTVDNAIATLELADLHSATLKKMTLGFICEDGRVGLVTKTKGWKELQSASLIKTALAKAS